MRYINSNNAHTRKLTQTRCAAVFGRLKHQQTHSEEMMAGGRWWLWWWWCCCCCCNWCIWISGKTIWFTLFFLLSERSVLLLLPLLLLLVLLYKVAHAVRKWRCLPANRTSHKHKHTVALCFHLLFCALPHCQFGNLHICSGWCEPAR